MIKVAIVGPESTGKSKLAMQLAQHYNCNWVKEYARTYLEHIDRDYQFEDLKKIAEGQIASEDALLKTEKPFLFCDTTLMVIKVWSEFKYATIDESILDQYKKRSYDLYLLCNIDLPWQDDILREHPHKREELFKIYQSEISLIPAPSVIISGTGLERLQNAIDAINLYKQKSHR